MAADLTPPSIVSSYPVDDSHSVPAWSNIFINFSEGIQRGAGNITLRSGSATGAIIESFDVATSTQILVGQGSGYFGSRQLVIDPSQELDANQEYFLVIDSGAITDLAGNAYSGLSNYNFNTTDQTAPSIAYSTPSNGSLQAPISEDISIVYNEEIQKGAGSIELRENSPTGNLVESFDVLSSSRIVVGTGSGYLDSQRLTVNPSSDLTPGITYYLVIPSGAVEDKAGNQYVGTSGYSFTADATPPTLSYNSPSGINYYSDVNIVLQFSEPIKAGLGSLTLREGSSSGPVVESFDVATSPNVEVGTGGGYLGDRTVTIDPTEELEASKFYYLVVDVGSITDLSGNSFSGSPIPSFQTSNSLSVLNPPSPLSGGGGGGSSSGSSAPVSSVAPEEASLPENDGSANDSPEAPSTGESRADVDELINNIVARPQITTLKLDEPVQIRSATYNAAIVGTDVSDVITGTDNGDLIFSGKGKDTLTGGGGPDVFLVSEESEPGKRNLVTILDFDPREGDVLLLDSGVFGGGPKKVKLKTISRRRDLKAAMRSKQTFIYDESRGLLYSNDNGKKKGFGDVGLFLELDSSPFIQKADIELI